MELLLPATVRYIKDKGKDKEVFPMFEFTLSNGVKMPAVGLGTFLMKPDQAEKAVFDALTMGYRMVDTANGYLNERAVGRGIKKSGVPRNEIFIATKLWPSVYEKDGAVDKCLELLGVDTIDLLYIHQPSGNYLAGYKQLEDAYKAGKIKAIGISNFHDEKLEDLLAHAEIKPHVIQLESHPYYTDTKTMDRLKEYGTRMVAWYPLGHGDKALMNEAVFTELAKKYGKSNAQIILRWHVQRGTTVIPGSTNPDHIRANADIFDFELTSEEMASVEKLNKNVRYYNATSAQEAATGST